VSVTTHHAILLFINLEGWSVSTKKDIDDLRETLTKVCERVGKRVIAVINHDGFLIDGQLYDDYAAMVQYLLERYYESTVRYATSAFMRIKMKEARRKRGISPHIFEQKEEAHAFMELQG
jgi:propionate CoA-transferase